MNYKLAFDKYLKDNEIYDHFYEDFNSENGVTYRKNSFSLGPFKNNYFCEGNAPFFISRAFRWIDHTQVNWVGYSIRWKFIAETQDKKYFVITLNEKIKIL